MWRVVGRVPNPPQADKKPDSGIATFLSRVGRGLVSRLNVATLPNVATPPADVINVPSAPAATRGKLSKLRGVRPTSAVILGMMLATCYALVAQLSELWTAPGSFLLKLIALNTIFIAYGIAVNRLKKHIGFNAIFIAILWLPLEYALSHYAGLESLFALSTGESSLLLGSLFGLLMISFIIVLINSLILAILRQVAQALLSRGALSIKDDKQAYPPFKEIILERRWYYFPDVRAPPLSIL